MEIKDLKNHHFKINPRAILRCTLGYKEAAPTMLKTNFRNHFELHGNRFGFEQKESVKVEIKVGESGLTLVINPTLRNRLMVWFLEEKAVTFKTNLTLPNTTKSSKNGN